MGIGASFGPTSLNAGSVNGVNFSTKNRASIDFMPGYVVSQSTLLYGKLSALSGTASAVDASGAETTSSLSGVGYGIGALLE